MKKLLCLILALAMVFALVACSDSKKHKAKGDDDDDDKKASKDQAIVSVDDDEDDKDDDKGTDVTIDEAVLVDESDVKITATGITFDEYFGTSIDLVLENNTGKDVYFSNEYTIVNGFAVAGYLYEDVADGKKANSTIDLYNSSLDLVGIETISEIVVVFEVIDNDSLDTIYISEPVTIETSAKKADDVNYDGSEGTVVYDEDDVKIVVVDTIVDGDYYSNGVVVYIENNSDKYICVQTEDVSVNGYMVSGYLYSYLPADTKAVDVVEVYDSDLEDNKIDKIEEMEITFYVLDYDEYERLGESDAVTVTF